MYRRQRRILVRLEQNFSSAMQRSLTKRKALAILYGRHLIYYMTKTEVCSENDSFFGLRSYSFFSVGLDDILMLFKELIGTYVN
jgi:hypothetical protein